MPTQRLMHCAAGDTRGGLRNRMFATAIGRTRPQAAPPVAGSFATQHVCQFQQVTISRTLESSLLVLDNLSTLARTTCPSPVVDRERHIRRRSFDLALTKQQRLMVINKMTGGERCLRFQWE